MSNITKQALEASLKRLLLQKPLTKITIADITEDCGVSRMTFYYHFQDIYDLLRWYLSHETEQALTDARDWREGMLAAFRYVQENNVSVYHVYRSSGRGHMDCQFFALSRALVIKLLALYAGDLPLSEADQDFLTDFYMYALSGTLVRWISDDMQEDPEVLVGRLERLLEPEIRHAAEQFVRPEPEPQS